MTKKTDVPLSQIVLYKSNEGVALVTKEQIGDDLFYDVGEALFTGGVRPHCFNDRKDLFKYLKSQKYRRVRVQ